LSCKFGSSGRDFCAAPNASSALSSWHARERWVRFGLEPEIDREVECALAVVEIDGLADDFVLLARVNDEPVVTAFEVEEVEGAVRVGRGAERAGVRMFERDADARLRQLPRRADEAAVDVVRAARAAADVPPVRADALPQRFALRRQ
jgi:hypothetical protein